MGKKGKKAGKGKHDAGPVADFENEWADAELMNMNGVKCDASDCCFSR